METDIDVIVDKLNAYFEFEKSSVRFKKRTEKTIQVYIEDKYLESFIINLTDEFINILESLLNNIGLSGIIYNNTRTILHLTDLK